MCPYLEHNSSENFSCGKNSGYISPRKYAIICNSCDYEHCSRYSNDDGEVGYVDRRVTHCEINGEEGIDYAEEGD